MIQPIPTDKSKIFKNGYADDIIRTGTISDGSCFFHALFYALSSTYRGLNEEERIQLIIKVRKEIARSITLNKWKMLGNGEIYRLQMASSLRDEIIYLCTQLYSTPSEQHLVMNKWDNELLPKLIWTDDVEIPLQIMLNQMFNREELNSKTILQKIEDDTLQNFIHHIETDWVDEFGIDIASEYVKCNIHFIQASNRKVYRTFSNHNYERNVVLCWIDDAHYECLGKIIPTNEGNKVQRVFSNSNPFIVNLTKNEEK